jgi:tetratricopeptide (TPR) repeat protein
VNEAGDYRFVQPDVTRLTPQQIQTALDRVQVCLRKTFQYAVSLNNIGHHDIDFAPGPSTAELNSFGPSSTLSGVSADAFQIAQKDHDTAHAWENYDAAMAEFTQSLIQDNFNNPRFIYDAIAKKYADFKPDQENMNDLGYTEMNSGHLPQALAIFQLNVQLYPDSWNVYDSLGEAYRKAGDKQQSIANYEKSLQLNPRNTSGARALEELKK